MSQKLKEYAESQYDFDAMSLEVIHEYGSDDARFDITYEYVGNVRPRTEEELAQLEEAAF
jgi:hypothetical protein